MPYAEDNNTWCQYCGYDLETDDCFNVWICECPKESIGKHGLSVYRFKYISHTLYTPIEIVGIRNKNYIIQPIEGDISDRIEIRQEDMYIIERKNS